MLLSYALNKRKRHVVRLYCMTVPVPSVRPCLVIGADISTWIDVRVVPAASTERFPSVVYHAHFIQLLELPYGAEQSAGLCSL